MKTMNLLEYKDIAEETGILYSTLRVMAKRGELPAPTLRVGQSPAWDRATIQDWIDEHKKA